MPFQAAPKLVFVSNIRRFLRFVPDLHTPSLQLSRRLHVARLIDGCYTDSGMTGFLRHNGLSTILHVI